jgi:hypothetical protein
MRRWFEPDRPSDFPARLTLFLGWVSFLPPFTPLTAVLAAVAGSLSHALCSRYPERYTGKPKIYLGLLLTLIALGLFAGEAALFFRWKERQAYTQRLAVSRFRMAEVSQAMERYREEKGVYPDAPSMAALEQALEPAYLQEVPLVDGFDAAFAGESRPEGFTLQCLPPPEQEGGVPPPPIRIHSAFQPAPPPPPPPAVDVNAPATEGGETVPGQPSDETGTSPAPSGSGEETPAPPAVNPASPPATPPPTP